MTSPEDASPKGLRSRTHVGLQVVGMLLIVCFFLPTAKGCDGKLIYPVESVTDCELTNVSSVMNAMVAIGAYGNMVVTANICAIAIALKSKYFLRTTSLVQFWVSLSVAVPALFLILTMSASLKDGCESLLAMLPLTVFPVVWIVAAWRQGREERAWGRLQHAWTVAAVFYVHMQCIFSPTVLIGYWLSMVALVGAIIFTEMSVRRLNHDWFDARQPVERFQFSMKQLFFWMTFGPLLIGYYQAIDPLLSMLFPVT